MSMRGLIIGAACFLAGAVSLVFAQTTAMRPDQFVAASWTWAGVQTFGPVIGKVTTQAGTTYTLAAADCGSTIRFTSASATTLTTLNSLLVGCGVAIEQAGAGQVTVANGSGATLGSFDAFTKTAGQWAIIGLFVDTNAGGSAAHYVLTGRGA